MKICRKLLHSYPKELSRCPDCRKAAKKIRKKRWKKAHPDVIKEKQKAWRVLHPELVKKYRKVNYLKNKDKQLSLAKRWRNANLERAKLIRKIYYENNKEHIFARNKAWVECNRGKKNASVNKRRAAKLQATPPWLTPEQLHSIELYYQAAQWVQGILKIPIHVDHIIPLQGKEVSGLHVPWNLQLLPAKENLIKSNNSHVE